MDDMENVLSVENLYKNYASKTAVDDISFHVARGETVGLLGPNGAGKTTTISMILGVLKPTAGKIRIGGIDLAADRVAAMSRTNFSAVYAPMPGNVSVFETLKFFGLLYDVPDLAARIEEVLTTFDLHRLRGRHCGVLSSGEAARVSLAKAVLSRPELLLLDEPTASLDPATARDIRRHIKDYTAAGKGGALWTSHNMHEVVEVCDRVLFLSHGKILLSGDPRTLPAQHGKETLEDLFISVAREPLTLTESAA